MTGQGAARGSALCLILGTSQARATKFPHLPPVTGQSAEAWCKFGVDDVESEMTQPAKVQEPSMEEILASIRRIIADDEAKPADSKPSDKPGDKAAAAPAAAPSTKPAMKDIPPSAACRRSC